LSWQYNGIIDYRPTLFEGVQETTLIVGASESVPYKAAER
jgi:hypothetical protein